MLISAEKPPLFEYERVWSKTQDMASAILSGDWEGLITLAAERELFMEEIKHYGDAISALSVAELTRKAELIQAIQAENHKIRTLVLERMTELQGWLASGQKTKVLQKTYDVA